ncbi:MAG: hypothetical protein ABI472_09135 [Ginsengibacter sp.]
MILANLICQPQNKYSQRYMCLRRSLISFNSYPHQLGYNMSLPAFRPLLPTHKAPDKKRPPRGHRFLTHSSPASPLRCACGGPALRLGGAYLTHKVLKRRAAKNPAHPDNALPDKKQNINTAQQHNANIYFCFIAGQSPRRKRLSFAVPAANRRWPAPHILHSSRDIRTKAGKNQNLFDRLLFTFLDLEGKKDVNHF